MDKVAKLPADQRRELFTETAARMNLRPGLIEKDFWVCWILKHLFSVPAFESHILFKGGTTLSKVFGVIERFSEDIDLAVDYEMLGFKGSRSPLKNMSSKKLDNRLKEMRAACEKYIATEFLDALQKRIGEHLSDIQPSWQLSVDPTDVQVVNFQYPATVDKISYVRPVVRLELGTRAELIPNDRYSIKPYAADYFPGIFEDVTCAVQAIKAERTFWEKATILHQEHHRKKEHGPPDRHSRHYYDLFMLARNEEIRKLALGDPKLLIRVVEHKKRFFRSAWAKYDLAVPATLQLKPSSDWVDFLRKDYEKMNVMLFGEVPSFDDILTGLAELEKSIRGMVP
jgi:hypothetical protein